MALSYTQIAALGSAAPVNLTFGYLDRTHVHVLIAGATIPDADWSWVTDGQIELDNYPAVSIVIRAYRTTPQEPLVTFTAGNLDPDDLNTANLQSIYIAQETADQTDELQVAFDGFEGEVEDDLVAANAAVVRAQEWASKDEDSAITDNPGMYSAKHHSAKANAQRVLAAGEATAAAGSAAAASASASAADQSADDAAASAASIDPATIAATIAARLKKDGTDILTTLRMPWQSTPSTPAAAHGAIFLDSTGLPKLVGPDAVVRSLGGGIAKSVLEWCVGDGVTNDSVAFLAALTASINGELVIPKGVTVLVDNITFPGSNIHISGEGCIKRKASSAANTFLTASSRSGIWIEGVEIDGNKANQTVGANNLQFTSCSKVWLDRIYTHDAKEASGWGEGISFITCTDDINSYSMVSRSRIKSNGAAGCHNEKSKFVHYIGNTATSNGAAGMSAIDSDATPAGSTCYGCNFLDNTCCFNVGPGLVVGNYHEGTTGAGGLIYGPNKSAADGCIVRGNRCSNNTHYGLVCQMQRSLCEGNVCSDNVSSTFAFAAGILFNCMNSTCRGNECFNNDVFGIDAGGCWDCIISDNDVSQTGLTSGIAGVGINIGGSIDTICTNNRIKVQQTLGGTGISAPGVEGDGATPFNTTGRRCLIAGNHIDLQGGPGLGIWVYWYMQQCQVVGNLIMLPAAANPENAIKVAEEDGIVEDNKVVIAGQSDFSITVASATTVVIPDWAEDVTISGTTTITGFRLWSQNQFFQRVRNVVISNPGSGYNPLSKPTVSFSGGGGSGAAGTAEISNDGKLIGVKMTNNGTGYTSTPTVAFSGGLGGAGVCQVGLLAPGRKRLNLFFTGTCTVNTGGTLSVMRAALAAVAGVVLVLRSANGLLYEQSRSLNS